MSQEVVVNALGSVDHNIWINPNESPMFLCRWNNPLIRSPLIHPNFLNPRDIREVYHSWIGIAPTIARGVWIRKIFHPYLCHHWILGETSRPFIDYKRPHNTNQMREKDLSVFCEPACVSGWVPLCVFVVYRVLREIYIRGFIDMKPIPFVLNRPGFNVSNFWWAGFLFLSTAYTP